MVTLKDAKKVIEAAEKKAMEIGQPMNIAVSDAGGNLVAHMRNIIGPAHTRGHIGKSDGAVRMLTGRA